MEEGRDAAGRFGPGNPGRIRGSKKKRPAVLAAFDDAAAADAMEIIQAVIAAARAGDMRAADILLRRLWPEPKGRPLEVPIPKLNGATSLTDAIGAIVTEVCKANLTPEEGHQVVGLLDMQRRAFEVAAFDERLKRIELALGQRTTTTTAKELPDGD